MKTKFKVWVEIERIETDDDGNEEDYIDEEYPVGVAYVNTLEEAVELQNEIVDQVGTIPNPEDFENLVQTVFNFKYQTDDDKYIGKNLAYLRSLSIEQLEGMLK